MAIPGEFPLASRHREELVTSWRNFNAVLDEEKIAFEAIDNDTGDVTIHFLPADDRESIGALGEIITHTFRLMSDDEVQQEFDLADVEARLYGIRPDRLENN